MQNATTKPKNDTDYDPFALALSAWKRSGDFRDLAQSRLQGHPIGDRMLEQRLEDAFLAGWSARGDKLEP